MVEYNRLIDKSEVDEFNFENPKSSKFKSKVGQVFGQLEVIKLAGRDCRGFFAILLSLLLW